MTFNNLLKLSFKNKKINLLICYLSTTLLINTIEIYIIYNVYIYI